MATKNAITGPVKAPTGSYPKLWRLLDHYFLKEDVPDRTALMALDTIVALNQAILESPKSVNNRAIRSSEPQIRNLVSMGGTDILTEVGWRFKVMRMEECWVFPYDADLELLGTQQAKIVETQQKLKTRMKTNESVVADKMTKAKEEKIAIMKQIEADKIEREHRQAIRSGAPPKPTQSLDDIRKQAIRERMERDKARKAKEAAESQAAAAQTPATRLPGTFPNARSGEQDSQDDDDESEDEFGAGYRRAAPVLGRTAGGPASNQRHTSRRARRTAPQPIVVKKPVVKETYMATENRLGGPAPDQDDSDMAQNDEDDDADLNSPS